MKTGGQAGRQQSLIGSKGEYEKNRCDFPGEQTCSGEHGSDFHTFLQKNMIQKPDRTDSDSLFCKLRKGRKRCIFPAKAEPAETAVKAGQGNSGCQNF